MAKKVESKSGGEQEFQEKRLRMVNSQIRQRGIKDERLLAVMERLPRHLFVPARFARDAYNDAPLPIGRNQTISQPYIVAYMIEQLELKGPERVLEIGTGSGYQTAVLAELSKMVFTIEIIPQLARRAESVLKRLNYENIRFRIGDGHLGWPEEAPFDAIIVSAAPQHVPQALIDQLDLGSRMIIPVGEEQQELIFIINVGAGTQQFRKIPVRFVPMTGDLL